MDGVQWIKNISRPARQGLRRRMQRVIKPEKIRYLLWLASSQGPRPSGTLKSIAVGPLAWAAIWHRWMLEGEDRFPPEPRRLYVVPNPGTKIRALLSYARRYRLRVFVETGTFVGSTVAALAPEFDECTTIELSPVYHARAAARFQSAPHVVCLEGDSSIILPKVLTTLDQPTLFWLDAHTSGGDTANSRDPIMDELTAILAHPIQGHVVLIDDARGHNIGAIANAVPPHLKMTVRNDIVRVTPRATPRVTARG
jgi:hypothetical protein